METTFNHTISYNQSLEKTSVWSRFINWCTGQQENRLLWLAIALAGHGCIFTPITVMIMLFSGLNLTLFILAIIAMGIALVTNLAAMPTRYTIPALVLSLLIDAGVIIAALSLSY
jgi:hypothetical protein